MNQNKKLLVDMDGTVCKFQKVDALEDLYEKGYFWNLDPITNVIDAVKKIIEEEPDIEVYILSSVLTDSKYALQEKNAWLDKYLPEIPPERRIFPPCGDDKKKYVPGGVTENDFLLDDYTNVLRLWNPPGKGIKIMNGINGTNGTWKADKLSIEKSSEELKRNIVDIMHDRKHYYDKGPLRMEESWKILDITLTHDGYARFDLLIRDKALGRSEDFKVSGLYRINDTYNGGSMQIVGIDTYGVSHSILRREYDEIEKAVTKEVFKAQILEGVLSVLDEAGAEVSRNKDLWGYWCGRVVNNEKPYEYLTVNLEGIKRIEEMRLCIEKVLDNKVVDSFECEVKVNPENEKDVEGAIYEMFLKVKDFARNSSEDFTISPKGFSLYTPDMYQKHTDILHDLGFEDHPKPLSYQSDNLVHDRAAHEMADTTQIRRGRR